MCCWLDSLGFESQYGREIFLFSKMCIPTLEPTQHCVHLVLVFFPGYTVLGCEDNHSPASSPEVNEWSCTSAVYICRMAWTRKTLPFPITVKNVPS